MRLATFFGILAIVFATQAAAQATNVAATYKAWSVYVHDDANGKICFAAAAPKSATPKDANRGEIYFYITNWQKDAIKHEVSVKIGYPFKPDSAPTVTVKGDSFSLFTRSDKAFLRDPEEERKLIQAMKAGSEMVVRGLSSRGTQTEDTYSLFGITAALNTLDRLCP